MGSDRMGWDGMEWVFFVAPIAGDTAFVGLIVCFFPFI